MKKFFSGVIQDVRHSFHESVYWILPSTIFQLIFSYCKLTLFYVVHFFIAC